MAHEELLKLTADYGAQCLDSLAERPVSAPATIEELREALAGALPEGPTDR